MAHRNNPLKAAIQVAQSREESAAKMLMESRKNLMEQQNRLQQLVGFRKSYSTLFQSEGGDGISARRFQDFSIFINSLDDGVMQSQRQLERYEAALVDHQQVWRHMRAKTKALEEVIARGRKEQLRLEERHEQRDNDEHNLRLRAFRTVSR